MNVLGIIAARGGSKRLPGKNIRPLAGRPLIAWTIQAALDSCMVDRLIVSTDCEEIAAAAKAAGAEVPFRRPAELATDTISDTEAILHALKWIEDRGGSPHWILCLQTTSPLRTGEDIRQLLERAGREGWREAASFREAQTGEENLWNVTSDGQAMPLDKTRAGGLSAGWIGKLNGAMYLIERDLLIERRGFFSEYLRAFRMPDERSVDIDFAEDFARAESIVNRRQNNPT